MRAWILLVITGAIIARQQDKSAPVIPDHAVKTPAVDCGKVSCE